MASYPLSSADILHHLLSCPSYLHSGLSQTYFHLSSSPSTPHIYQPEPPPQTPFPSYPPPKPPYYPPLHYSVSPSHPQNQRQPPPGFTSDDKRETSPCHRPPPLDTSSLCTPLSWLAPPPTPLSPQAETPDPVHCLVPPPPSKSPPRAEKGEPDCRLVPRVPPWKPSLEPPSPPPTAESSKPLPFPPLAPPSPPPGIVSGERQESLPQPHDILGEDGDLLTSTNFTEKIKQRDEGSSVFAATKNAHSRSAYALEEKKIENKKREEKEEDGSTHYASGTHSLEAFLSSVHPLSTFSSWGPLPSFPMVITYGTYVNEYKKPPALLVGPFHIFSAHYFQAMEVNPILVWADIISQPIHNFNLEDKVDFEGVGNDRELGQRKIKRIIGPIWKKGIG